MFLQRSEASKALHLVRESTRNNVATVVWTTGTLDGEPKTIRIPVDSEINRITFAFSVDAKGNELKLTQPSGGAMADVAAGTEVTELNCGRVVTVSSPEAGEWRAEITGRGRYWLQAQAQSDIYLVRAEFVKEGGRPGHEGLHRIQGQPVAGATATLQVSLSATGTRTTEFFLMTEEGQPLQKLQMPAVNSERQFLEFVGRVDLPTQPFRVAVGGTRRYRKAVSEMFCEPVSRGGCGSLSTAGL
jgi:hypothetical protein